MKSTRPYSRLRESLSAAGISVADVARTCLLTPTSLSRRLNNKAEWTLDECYTILDMLGFSPSMIPLLFPRGGFSEDTDESRKEDKKALIMAALKELI